MKKKEFEAFVRSMKCRRCAKTEAAMIRYNGFFMGWFCDEHRPDQMKAKMASQMLEAYRDDGSGLLVFPIEFNDKAHPFFNLVQLAIKGGLAKFDKIVTTLTPKFKRLNRAERRAEKRRS